LRASKPSPLDQRLRAKHHRMDPRKQTPGGRHQIGIPAGFRSESVAGFLLECVAGFVGNRSEIRAACTLIRADGVQPAFKLLARVARIFEQLNSAWDVLRTMTPSDYSEFRDRLGQSSGFQSWQYRAIEFLAGNRNLAMLRPHDHRPEIVADLTAILSEPSLYQEAILLLSRRGLDVGEAAQRAVAAEPHVECEALIGAWAEVYWDPAHYWDLYELAEKLIDFEDYLRRWRFNHVTTVERIIGLKRGTGGTSGVGYLKRMLEIELFPELWRVRTRMWAQSPRPSPSLIDLARREPGLAGVAFDDRPAFR
jgi:tryptophan 2,3-dioxygenase